MPFPRHHLPGRRPRHVFRALGAATLAACGLAAQAQSDLQTLVSTGQYLTALDKVEAESAQAPRDARLTAQRAMLLSLHKRDVQALRLLEGLAARQPELAQPHHLMALILAGGGDVEGARAAVTRALRADRGYLPALTTLGELQARLSRQAFEQALKLDSGNAVLRSRVSALSALIGPEVAGSGSSPFAQPGALAALAPPSGPASPAEAQRLVALPAGVANAEVAAATRHGEASRVITFNGVATGAPPSTRFFGVPTLNLNVDAEPAATVVALAPASAAAPPSPAQAEVSAALRDWAAAWSRRDVAGYLAAYVPEFAGGAASREAWERERRERIGARARISVELSELVVSVNGDRAEARFRQRYASDTVNSVDRKLLQWQRMPGGGWRISKEAVEGTP